LGCDEYEGLKLTVLEDPDADEDSEEEDDEEEDDVASIDSDGEEKEELKA